MVGGSRAHWGPSYQVTEDEDLTAAGPIYSTQEQGLRSFQSIGKEFQVQLSYVQWYTNTCMEDIDTLVSLKS